MLPTGFITISPIPGLVPNILMASGSRRVCNKPGHAKTGGWIRPRCTPRKGAFGIFGSRGFTPESSDQRSYGVTPAKHLPSSPWAVSPSSVAAMSDTGARVISPVETMPAHAPADMKASLKKKPKQSSFLHPARTGGLQNPTVRYLKRTKAEGGANGELNTRYRSAL